MAVEGGGDEHNPDATRLHEIPSGQNELGDTSLGEELLDKSSAAPQQKFEFSFHGQGDEYFRIWIVNVILSVVTLGIYSAWAKVRTNRYFFANTELDGDRFDYLANPKAILKGRMVAMSLLAVYTVVQILNPLYGLLLIPVVLALVPFLLVRALRFKASMTMWRGVRLSFHGDVWGAIKAFVLWPLFGILTLGFGMPHAWFKQNQYVMQHHQFGTSRSTPFATSGDFYGIYGSLFLFGLLVFVVTFVLSMVAIGADQPQIFEFFDLILTFAVYLGTYIIYQALRFKIIFNHIKIHGGNIKTSATLTDWAVIAVTNTLLMIVTLGLFYPWASVRMTRYKLEHVWLELARTDDVRADENQPIAAFGDEIGEAFDLGLGV